MENRLKIREDFLVFLDETGQEELEDPHFPVFGLAGCALPATMYDSLIKQPWLSIYIDYFGNQSIPLHASKASHYDSYQKSAIANFFQKQPFVRVAAVVNNKSAWPTGLFRYQIVAGVFQERLRRVLKNYEFESIAMIFESCQRTDHLAEKYFSKARFFNKQQKEISIKGYFIQKRKELKGEPGLEVADFIANAVGGRACARANGKNDARLDFQSIFGIADRSLVSFLEVADVASVTPQQALSNDLKNWDFYVHDLVEQKSLSTL